MSTLELYTAGTRAWLPDEKEGWLSTVIVKVETAADQSTIKFKLKDDKGQLHDKTANLNDPKSFPPLRNPPMLEGIDDLTNLSYLHEPAVMHNVKLRYLRQTIYTYSGIVLVAVNPFAQVDLYSPDIAKAYFNRRRGELEPHLFAVAEDAYRFMVREQTNQSIIVSGESGAGKTVSAKYIMRYFAAVGNFERQADERPVEDRDGDGWDLKGVSDVEEQVLATNPIMEAFGNAKTTRNDNSSRFGKYIEIQFDEKTEIIGAKIRTYLLERSRVVFQPAQERNYHIFYQLCAGAPTAERKELGLLSYDKFFYLNQGAQGVINGVDDAEEFEGTQRALSTIGIPVSLQWSIFRLLAAVLHLGNVKITPNGDECNIDENDQALAQASSLMGIPVGELRLWLIQKMIKTRFETIVTPLNASLSAASRDAVAKYIYNTLFEWLVSRVNESLSHDENDIKTFIGVLDIYGFEHFKRNSFEQFCINYANEKLQQEFNQHVFKLEQEEYVKEKINWSFIDFNDNKPCIDMIETKMGILDMLDEQCRLPSGTDEAFVSKLYNQFIPGKNTHPFFSKPRFSNLAFTVHHYAHAVTYEADGFLDKNKDTMPEEILILLQESSFEYARELFKKPEPDAAAENAAQSSNAPGPRKVATKPTLGSAFKLSLQKLMDTISSTNAHYIRCIKPNEAKKAFLFENVYVLNQLRACGVLETIRISCAGYPSRFNFVEFAERYRLLLLDKGKSLPPKTKDARDVCQLILKKCLDDEDKYQLGITKIFLRAGQLAYFEKLRSKKLAKAATTIQKYVRGYLVREKYRALRKATIKIQSAFRGYVARKKATRLRQTRAAICIQSHWRGYACRKRFKTIRQSIISLQSVARGFLLRKKMFESKKIWAATQIQAVWRGYRCRKAYRAELRKIILVQSCYRRRLARRQLKQLRVEARSVNHFQAKAGALENKVIELTQMLDKARQEAKVFQEKVEVLENQIVAGKEKTDKAERQLAEAHKNHNAALSQKDVTIAQLTAEKETLRQRILALEEDLRIKSNEISKLNNDIQALQAEKVKRKDSIMTVKSTFQDSERVAIILAENVQLKEKLSRALSKGRLAEKGLPTSSSNASLSEVLPVSGTMTKNELMDSLGISPVKTIRRRSSLDSTRGVTPQFNKNVASSILATSSESPKLAEKVKDGQSRPEMLTFLNDSILERDIVEMVVVQCKIPRRFDISKGGQDLLLPANILGAYFVQMWRHSLTDRVSFLFADIIRTVQSVQNYQDTMKCAFWLANITQLYFIVMTVLEDGSGPGRRRSDSSDMERVLSKYRNSLESLMLIIYSNWLKQMKRSVQRLVIPAMIEHQSLPGFKETTSGYGFFNKIMGNSGDESITTETLLQFMTDIHETLNFYGVTSEIRRHFMVTMIKYIGATAFNELLVRKNFCTWKRGMQVQYNVTHLEEWCNNHDVSEATLHLEPLMQATKLLQLNKTGSEDADIMFDVCFLLTATQIKKLLVIYVPEEFETPVSSDVHSLVAMRASEEADTTLLLDTNDDAPFVYPTCSRVDNLQCSIPSELLKQVPQLNLLASS